MAEYERRRKIYYYKIDCPHCGNEITAKSIDEDQKCPHCRRKYKINCTRRGKKFYCEPVAIDYSYEAEGRPFVGDRLERDTYGRNSKG